MDVEPDVLGRRASGHQIVGDAALAIGKVDPPWGITMTVACSPSARRAAVSALCTSSRAQEDRAHEVGFISDTRKTRAFCSTMPMAAALCPPSSKRSYPVTISSGEAASPSQRSKTGSPSLLTGTHQDDDPTIPDRVLGVVEGLLV